MNSQPSSPCTQRLIQNKNIFDKLLRSTANTPFSQILRAKVKKLPVIDAFLHMADALLEKSEGGVSSLQHIASIALGANLPPENHLESGPERDFSVSAVESERSFFEPEGDLVNKKTMLLSIFIGAKAINTIDQVGLERDKWFLGRKDQVIGIFYEDKPLVNCSYITLGHHNILGYQLATLKILNSDAANLVAQEEVVALLEVSRDANARVVERSGTWDVVENRLSGKGAKLFYDAKGRLFRTVEGTWGDRGNGRWGLTGEGIQRNFDSAGKPTKELSGTWGDRGNGRDWGITGEGTERHFLDEGKLIIEISGTWGDMGNGCWSLTGEAILRKFNADRKLIKEASGTLGDMGNGLGWGLTGEGALRRFDAAGKITQEMLGTWDVMEDGHWGMVPLDENNDSNQLPTKKVKFENEK